MNYGFVKVAAAVPHVQVADCFYNIDKIEDLMREASEKGVQIIAFPELSVTAYTCLDLFAQQTLVNGAEAALIQLINNTADLDILTIVGVPLRTENRLINAAVVFQKGVIRGVVPKTYLPNYKEFQEQRWFTSATELRESTISIGKEEYPLGSRLLFRSGRLSVGIEICEDLWVPVPPSSLLAMEGANIIFNLSASNELIGKHAYLRSLICQQSARCMAGYVYASSGFGESSTDLVFAGNGIIAENGNLLAESPRFTMEEQLVISEIDIETLQNDRQVNTSFMYGASGLLKEKAQAVDFQLRTPNGFSLTRPVDPHPFTPSGDALKERCEEIFHIQVAGLAKRLVHTHAQTAVVGISGGLDSTLALLVTVMTFDALKMPREQIIGLTMPGFGTTDRTYTNACDLIRSLGVTLKEISIKEACLQHFHDIGHDPSVHDVTYENSQARERTQLLMDIANRKNGLVIGTGDLSELALGWATYNGDHMSMYGVNGSIPKTLVKYLVEWVANNKVDNASRLTLLDIDQPRTDPGRRKRQHQTKDRGPGRPVRTARLFPLPFPAFRLPSVQDIFPGTECVCRHLRQGYDQEMALHLLPPLLPTTIQAQLPAGRSQSRLRQPLATWRLAHAERCDVAALAGRDREYPCLIACKDTNREKTRVD